MLGATKSNILDQEIELEPKEAFASGYDTLCGSSAE
jgi:hypothetical protein